MKRSTFKILFYLNTSKQKKSGMCPVMGRITVGDTMKEQIQLNYDRIKREALQIVSDEKQRIKNDPDLKDLFKEE